MLMLPTVILRHTRPADTHLDWLFPRPDDPAGPLLTLQLRRHPGAWAVRGAFLVTRLPDHRRRYLTWEGPLDPLVPRGPGATRGYVRRIDRGQVIPRRFGYSHITLDVQLQHFVGLIELRRLAQGEHWRAVVVTQRQAC